MRVGLLGVLLVLAMGSGVVAQEPSPEPPPWSGGRIEMPEHGFAVTVPEGWLALDPDEDVDVQAWVTWVDPIATVDNVRYLSEVLARARSEGVQLALMDDPTGSFCGFVVKAKRAIETGEFADRLASAMSSDDRFIDVERPRAIELPAGPSFVIFATTDLPDDAVGPSPVTYYLVDSDESVLLASCVGPERPEDDWLSIAESFEFLPAEE